MQTANDVRGYSDFFASGFRAVTTRPSTSSGSRSSVEPVNNAWFSSARNRRARPTSMILQNARPTPTTREKSRGRRSSFVSFSSRLFDRLISTSGDDTSTSRASRSSGGFGSSDESAPEVWISAGGPSAPNGSAMHQPIDPFNSSPDTRSMFIDLSSDSSPFGTPKGESFLSLTGSSSRSSLILTRRERPTSIHTMPLPSRSRRSSFQYRAPSQEKSDFFLILEEEPSLAGVLEDHEEWDAPAKIDWRQFHIDILTDDTQ